MDSKERKNIRRPSRRSKEDDSYLSQSMWEGEKQKLEKKYESQKKALEKERKRLETERKATEKKRQRYLKEKSENDKLKIYLNAEKEIWLNRHKRSKNFDGPNLLAVVVDKIKEWEGKQDEAKQEWANIDQARADMEERRNALEADRERLKDARAKLQSERKELETRTEVIDNFVKKNMEEEAEIKVMSDQLKSSEKELQRNKKEYDALNVEMDKRELAVREKFEEIAKERELVDNIRKNLISSLEQSRLEFVEKSDELQAEVNKWKSSFAQLLSVEEKSAA